MSDFIYSKKTIYKGKLTKEIQRIYHKDAPSVKEFHGEWGSLAVSRNLYSGFQYYETKDIIFIVIGGPVLSFRGNEFLNNDNDNDNTGSKALYHRWVENKIKWEEDLSGPYSILIINKISSEVRCITDLMSFIPVYYYQDSTNMMLSTHVDILANVSKQENNVDVVSYADFILHSVVTFPYTIYKGIYQINPASIYLYNSKFDKLKSKPYWAPEENYSYKSINEAAEELREGLKKFLNSVTSEAPNIAQFISGGEDSRVLSALLQENSRDAFVFLDQMNREGKKAKKAAKVYKANFKMKTRTKMHYLDILPECSDLVGSGSQYHHAHTFKFHQTCNLISYSAVFGGLFSDALLKGSHVNKLFGSGRFPFMPDLKRRGYSAATPVDNPLFKLSALQELTYRRQSHLNYVKSFRGDSAEEWFELWPSSMNLNVANIYANRRLFRSYEPFTANDIVKLSASIPQRWKLNRRLFHKVAKPLLKPTKWLFHGDGRLPYFPWYINFFVQFVVWVYQNIGIRAGFIRGNQGPWGQWNVIISSSEWDKKIDEYKSGMSVIKDVLNKKDLDAVFKSDHLNSIQKVNLLQTIYKNHKKKNDFI